MEEPRQVILTESFLVLTKEQLTERDTPEVRAYRDKLNHVYKDWYFPSEPMVIIKHDNGITYRPKNIIKQSDNDYSVFVPKGFLEYDIIWNKALEKYNSDEAKRPVRVVDPNAPMCGCGKNNEEDDHTCPYQRDVNNNHESLCNCCDECEGKCSDQI